MGWRYLDLADYLLIAEAVLEIPAEQLAQLKRLGLAESALNAPAGGYGEDEAYPDFETKAAVLCWHLVKNHPLPDGNKRAGFLSLLEPANEMAVRGSAPRTIPSRRTRSFVVWPQGQSIDNS